MSSTDNAIAGTVYDAEMPGEPGSLNQPSGQALEEKQMETDIMSVENIGATSLNLKVRRYRRRRISFPLCPGTISGSILEVINSVVARKK